MSSSSDLDYLDLKHLDTATTCDGYQLEKYRHNDQYAVLLRSERFGPVHAETSLAAFQQKMENGTLKTDRQRVKYLIREHGPITSIELQMWMQKPKHTFSGRITDLKNQDEIKVVGVKDGHEQYQIREEKQEVEQPLLVDKENGEVIAE